MDNLGGNPQNVIGMVGKLRNNSFELRHSLKLIRKVFAKTHSGRKLGENDLQSVVQLKLNINSLINDSKNIVLALHKKPILFGKKIEKESFDKPIRNAFEIECNENESIEFRSFNQLKRILIKNEHSIKEVNFERNEKGKIERFIFVTEEIKIKGNFTKEIEEKVLLENDCEIASESLKMGRITAFAPDENCDDLFSDHLVFQSMTIEILRVIGIINDLIKQPKKRILTIIKTISQMFGQFSNVKCYYCGKLFSFEESKGFNSIPPLLRRTLRNSQNLKFAAFHKTCHEDYRSN